MREFKNVISNYFGQLSEEESALLRSYFREETLSKKDFFTKTGQYCDRLSLVKSGILRIYALSDGKEITQWISTPNYFITEISGFFFDQPNRWSIQALSDVALLTIDKASYLELCKAFPKWNEIEKKFLANCFAMMEDRIFAHLSMSAEERYKAYFQQNSELFNQVPLQYLASVLGMSAETFSRIRKRQTKNS